MSADFPVPTALADLLDILPDAVVIVTAQGVIGYVNPAVRALLGYARDEIVGQPLSTLVPQAMRARHEAMVEKFRDGGAPTMMGSRPVLRAVHKTGRLVPVSISLCNMPLSNGEVASVAVVHDISLLHTHLDRATLQAQTDALTGLGNRLLLSRQIQADLENARPFALLLMDLTGFKGLNDRHGHAAGDDALCVVGQRLQSLVRDTDVAARLGGDEFVLVLDGLTDTGRLQAIAQSVADSLARPLRLEGVTVTLGVNIGGALYPGHGDTENELLGAADRAMYEAKQARQAYRLAD
ncbi:sensor domain-containing diguanylate cyclase [uncultured Piscinibacter sp.]|uniref:sensor domain-containing diguanylate cyclase n=1 Tax=uncultured Piscinibacter sp. TaxID=1131835 RepID=UPI0026099C77|nr:sensor domain-containing diguanylate cyclase [uncultured Piscinibacter sp.]